MADPVYLLVSLGLALGLLIAATIPAPSRPAEEQPAVGLALIVVGSLTALAMGIVGLLGHAVAAIVLGAIAWVVVTPCIWLARAPQPLDDGPYEEDEDDDDGSPSPQAPSAPPAPDDPLPGLQPPVAAPARSAWTPAPQAEPVLATAARVQRLLAAQEAERLLAAQEVERLLAASARIPLPEIPTAPAPAPAAPAPLHTPAWPRLAPPPRVRADHRSVAHMFAAVAHAHTRRAAAVAKRRAQASALRD